MKQRHTLSEMTAMKFKALLIGLVLCLAGPGLAQTAAAESEGSILQEDVVDEVNASMRTLVIAGETFEVGSTASLEDAKGRSIALSEIRATRNDGQGDFVAYALAGRGEAKNASGLRSIESLRVLGGDYE